MNPWLNTSSRSPRMRRHAVTVQGDLQPATRLAQRAGAVGGRRRLDDRWKAGLGDGHASIVPAFGGGGPTSFFADPWRLGRQFSAKNGWWCAGTVGPVQQLLPEPRDDIDPAAVHASHRRTPPPERPWVALNMVVSVDGATQVDGRSGGSAVRPTGGCSCRCARSPTSSWSPRARCGRSTMARLAPRRVSAAQRLARGQAECPRIAIVSGSLDLDLDAALFTAATEPPLLFTSPAADPAKVREHRSRGGGRDGRRGPPGGPARSAA